MRGTVWLDLPPAHARSSPKCVLPKRSGDPFDFILRGVARVMGYDEVSPATALDQIETFDLPYLNGGSCQ